MKRASNKRLTLSERVALCCQNHCSRNNQEVQKCGCWGGWRVGGLRSVTEICPPGNAFCGFAIKTLSESGRLSHLLIAWRQCLVVVGASRGSRTLGVETDSRGPTSTAPSRSRGRSATSCATALSHLTFKGPTLRRFHLHRLHRSGSMTTAGQ